jgi:hypothetical protein
MCARAAHRGSNTNAFSDHTHTMTATQTLDQHGIDEVCRLLLDGVSLRGIAAKFEIRQAAIFEWIAADSERSARVSAAREMAADLYAELAGEATEYKEGMGKVEASMRKEKAHHLRWLASMSNPRRFGTKVELNATVGLHTLADDELDAQAAEYQRQIDAANEMLMKAGLPPVSE